MNFVILAAALAAGGWLRFSNLGEYQLTSDEGCSWGAAAQPTIIETIRRGMWINRGLALHDLLLRAWIAVFGDGVTAMRALSAALGTLAILVVFALAREFFSLDSDSPHRNDAESIAAISALIFALNLVAIGQSREARMYSLTMTLGLAQAWFFIRSTYRGGLLNYALTGVAAIGAVAASFTALSLFCVEGLWLLYLLVRHGWRPDSAKSRRVWAIALALAASAAVLAALIPWGVRPPSYDWWLKWFPGAAAAVVRRTILKSIVSPIVLLTLGLAAYGAARSWRWAREAVEFALVWMWLPVVMVTAWLVTPLELTIVAFYGWIPIFVQRYVLTSIAPFCILVAAGIWELRYLSARLAALTLLVALALVRIHDYQPGHDDVQWGAQWQEAAALVLPELKQGRPVDVELPESTDVLRYYLRGEPSIDPGLVVGDNPDAALVVISDQAVHLMDRAELARATRAGQATLVARFKRVSVLKR